MKVCFHCGKGNLYGRSHTHHRGVAGGRWKKRAPKTRRIFVPNLQKVSVILKGKEEGITLCTKCLKRIRFDMKNGDRPFYKLASSMSRSKAEAGTEAKKAVTN